MTAPRWIAEALEHAAPAGVMGTDAEALAAALLERLPLEAMTVRAADEVSAIDPAARAIACSAVLVAIRVLVNGDPEVVELTELYQGACKVLDDAGVPHAVDERHDETGLSGPPRSGQLQLNLAARIRWLAQQRPTRLELQRVVGERDAARALMDATVKLAADRAAELYTVELALAIERSNLRQVGEARDMRERERDAWHRRYDECIVTITANQQSIAALIDESETRRRERDQARATVADLTDQRAATERALTRAGAPMDELTNEQGAVWLHREIDAIKERLRKAETERDALRGLLASG